MSFNKFFRLLENKEHLINKLNISDEEKDQLIQFFKKHPEQESKIDWNKKDLTFKDFTELLSIEGQTKNQIKKYGISGKSQFEDLEEGTDYEIIHSSPECIVFYVKTFKASEVLAKPTTPPEGVTGKWCISGRNYSPGTRDQHWIKYSQEGTKFFFIFTENKKYAIAVPKPEIGIDLDNPRAYVFHCFDQEDRHFYAPPYQGLYADKIKEKCKELFTPMDPIIGPAGGFQFYDKGFESDGWRYIECAPYDITSNDLWKTKYQTWNYQPVVFGYAISKEKDPWVYGVGTSMAIGAGKENTDKLVAAIGTRAAKALSSRGTISGPVADWAEFYAAKACKDFELNGYKDWYLPSFKELQLIKDNLWKNGLGHFTQRDAYWTSSESFDNDLYAWTITFNLDKNGGASNKGFTHWVRPIRYYK